MLLARRNILGKKWLAGILTAGLVVAGISLPGTSFADFFGIGAALGGIAGKAIAAVVLGILGGVMATSALLLDWAVDPSFIRHPYTCLTLTCKAGEEISIVGVGWPVVRDFANMLLVLMLIAIALGTALRIRSYEFQKTLPLLIGVALLINFTPVLLGVIVDAANIVMRFFLEGFSVGSIVSNVMIDQINSIGGGLNILDPESWFTFFFKLVFMAVWIILATIIFLLFAVLMIMRRVAIWLLVILSPLAFVAYIIPLTRGYFKTWWHQFLQWTIIGVSAAFFLWLSEWMINFAGTGGKFISKAGGPAGQFEQMINGILPYGIAILFMGFGFFMALSTSAIGASGVIAGARKTTRQAPGRVWKSRPVERAKMTVAARARDYITGDRTLPQLRLWGGEARLAKKIPVAGKPIAGAMEAGGRGVEWITQRPKAIGGWGARGAAKITPEPIKKPLRLPGEAQKVWGEIAASKLTEYVAEKREATKFKPPKAFEAWTPREQESYIKGVFSEKDRATLLKTMDEKGTLQLTSGEFQERAMQTAEAIKNDATSKKELASILNALPDKLSEKLKTALETSGLKGPEKEQKERELREKIESLASALKIDRDQAARAIHVRDMKSDDISKISKNALKERGVQEAVHMWDGSQIAAAAKTFKRDFVEPYMQEAERRGLEWYEKNNPKSIRYSRQLIAQELGFRMPNRGGEGHPDWPALSTTPPGGGGPTPPGGTPSPSEPPPGTYGGPGTSTRRTPGIIPPTKREPGTYPGPGI